MENIETLLMESAASCGLEITKEQAEKFQIYLEQLVEWNQKINLTAITEPKDVAVKHFLDSMLLLKYMQVKPGTSLIDVGTGAGFPGVPLKVMRPELNLTLLDSLNKRLIFLQDLTGKLDIQAAVVHARGEEGGRKKELREKFDYASARAVAQLNLLCEYCLPFLKIGGEFLAMKGPDVQKEVKAAKNAITVLGCELVEIEKFALPNGDARSLVRIRRVKPLYPAYPRVSAKIAKQPL